MEERKKSQAEYDLVDRCGEGSIQQMNCLNAVSLGCEDSRRTYDRYANFIHFLISKNNADPSIRNDSSGDSALCLVLETGDFNLPLPIMMKFCDHSRAIGQITVAIRSGQRR